jgi:hypothetical protein
LLGSGDLFRPFRSTFLFLWESSAAACLSALCPVLGCRRLGGWPFLQGFPRLLRRRPPRPLEVFFLCLLNFLAFGLCILGAPCCVGLLLGRGGCFLLILLVLATIRFRFMNVLDRQINRTKQVSFV